MLLRHLMRDCVDYIKMKFCLSWRHIFSRQIFGFACGKHWLANLMAQTVADSKFSMNFVILSQKKQKVIQKIQKFIVIIIFASFLIFLHKRSKKWCGKFKNWSLWIFCVKKVKNSPKFIDWHGERVFIVSL
jgi:hypothetical protein